MQPLLFLYLTGLNPGKALLNIARFYRDRITYNVPKITMTLFNVWCFRPAGSQYGLLAALLVEVLNSWPMLKHPLRATAKLTGVLGVLLLAGFLPWIDNYAHAFGFLGGVMLSLTFMPYLTFMTQQVGGSHCSTLLYTKRGRIHVMVASSAAYVILRSASPFRAYSFSSYTCF